MKIEIPKFDTKKELFNYLKENHEDLIFQKKSEIKRADDDFGFAVKLINPEFAAKSSSGDAVENQVKVRAVINTTNIRDSHKDVHLDGIWKKSLKENKRIKHLQEHKMSFDAIISDKDDLKAFTKTYTWKELGYDYEGKTQALVFDSTVKESRNPSMYKEYKDENVDNHSVGMQYVNIKMAIDSDEEGDEQLKAEFDKHIDLLLNKDEVMKDGYYWAVYEAKAIEGSAVPMGSNPMTPTVSTKAPEDNGAQEKKDAIKNWLLK